MSNVVYVAIGKVTRSVYITDFTEAKFVMSSWSVNRAGIAAGPNS